MTCYIFRDYKNKPKELVGPFTDAEQAMTHREEMREEAIGAKGRRRQPPAVGVIVSAEEAMQLMFVPNCLGIKRMTPEQDYYATDKDEQETHTERVA